MTKLDREPYPTIGGKGKGDTSKSAERIGHAMKHVGLSISLTSFCSGIAFAVGTNVSMPGVQAFCVVASIAFFANYS